MLISFLIVTNLISLAALAWLFKEYIAKSDLIDYMAEHEPELLQQILERCLRAHSQSLAPKYKKIQSRDRE